MRSNLPILTLVLALSACAPAAAQECPTVEALQAYEPPEATRLFAADGSFLADLSWHRRVVVALEEIPEVVREGFIAVEDRRFWDHDGIDARGVLRAAAKNAATLSMREGFSTITMQLARTVFPEQLPMSSKVGRKLCEVRLAPQIERAFEKRQILGLYLNQLNLGEGYGVEAAAQSYFGKSVRDVTAAEAAVLIGAAKSPSGYNPRKNPTAAVRRRNVVLDVMAREGVITAEQAAAAKKQPIRLTKPLEAATSAPYYVAAVRRELRDRFGADADIAGLRVHTALDHVVQRAATEALRTRIREIEAGSNGRYRHPVPGKADLAPAAGSGSPYLQGMVVAMDPGTGELRALVGGRDFTHSQYDRALRAKRQPGSAFKPIVYAAALERGLTLSGRLATSPVAVASTGSPTWRPSDHVADSVETLSVRDALALSSNHAAVRVGQWAGEQAVVELAHRLGISSDIPLYPSIHLGAAEVVPVELVAAYAPFGNGGFRVEPTLVTRVEDGEGNVLWTAPRRAERVLDEGTAFLTLSVMQDVVDRGTATSIRRAGFWLPAAGKTGTTNDEKDAWFVGMTPDLLAGVWLGLDRPQQILPGAGGGGLAAPAWADMMKRVYTGREAPAGWEPPVSLLSLPIDDRTGGVATGNCPPEDVRIEYFREGTEPGEFCPLHPESGFERFFDRLFRRITGRGEGG